MRRPENIDTLKSYIIACCADGKISAQEYNYLKQEAKRSKLSERDLRKEIHIALLNMGKDKKRKNNLKSCVVFTKEALKYDTTNEEALRLLNESVDSLTEKELLDLARTTIDGFETYKTILFEKIKEKGKDYNSKIYSKNKETKKAKQKSDSDSQITSKTKGTVNENQKKTDKSTVKLTLPTIFKDPVLYRKGGMALIYTATLNDPNSRWHERKIIIKQIKPDKRDDSTYQKLFFKEYNILRNLEHENILRVIRKGEDNYGHYYISEYISGKNLDELIDNNIGLTKRFGKRKRIVQILNGLLNGLQGMHEESIIHCDLKPANIIITNTANKVKIIDFGLAKTDVYDDKIKEAGTPPYNSPEQKGTYNIDNRTDIYSVGVIMLEMVSGWKGKENAERLPDSLKEIKRIIIKCTEDDPNNRYNYVSEIIDEINKNEVLFELKLCGSKTIDEIIKKSRKTEGKFTDRKTDRLSNGKKRKNKLIKILIPVVIVAGIAVTYFLFPEILTINNDSQQTVLTADNYQINKTKNNQKIQDDATTVFENKDKPGKTLENRNINLDNKNSKNKKITYVSNSKKWDYDDLISFLNIIYNNSNNIDFDELYKHINPNCEVYYLINGEETGQPVGIKSFITTVKLGTDWKIVKNSLKYDKDGKIIRFQQQ